MDDSQSFHQLPDWYKIRLLCKHNLGLLAEIERLNEENNTLRQELISVRQKSDQQLVEAENRQTKAERALKHAQTLNETRGGKKTELRWLKQFLAKKGLKDEYNQFLNELVNNRPGE